MRLTPPGVHASLRVVWTDAVSGHGVEATRSIGAHEYLLDYAGRSSRQPISGPYVMEVQPGRLWLDGAKGGNLSRYLNHACEPNCVVYVEPRALRAMIFTLRRIELGEELTIQYDRDVRRLPFVCRCARCPLLIN
jgi:hypothetical protein